jgi:3,4-dihydroxy-9,10-secoandrosta-1,3,5(10)-triene-9,17-dione 4,5-dioxygenase
MPSPSEAPSGGAKPFGSFLAFAKGTRRKGETISRRYRSNGYVLRQQSPTDVDVDGQAQGVRGQENQNQKPQQKHARRPTGRPDFGLV